MMIQPVQPTKPQPTFGWTIRTTTTMYGRTVAKVSEYLPENGKKLIILDTFRNGEQVSKSKELYDAHWKLLAKKVIDFKDGVIERIKRG